MHISGSTLSWIIVIGIILIIFRPFKKAANKPHTGNQQALVNEILTAIDQNVPDFEMIKIGGNAQCRPTTEAPTKSGGVQVYKGRILYYAYDFEAHGYSVGEKMWGILASEIVKRYGGKYTQVTQPGLSDHNEIVGYRVISGSYINAERERQNNMRRC